MYYVILKLLISRTYKHNAELQRADPTTQKYGKNDTCGRFFPTQCLKQIFIISVVSVEKKHAKLIYQMPWFKSSLSPWIMEVLK